jgi:hypothetical protein
MGFNSTTGLLEFYTGSQWKQINSTYDTTSSSTGYFDLPIGTTAERPASPTNGELRINSTTNYVEVYYAGVWTNIITVGFGDFITSNLYIHYDFSNSNCYSGSGTAINDLQGTQGGTITGATFGGTGLAKYLSFSSNGSTYVQMGSSVPAGQSTSALTMEAWIYTTGLTGTNNSDGIGAIISSQNDGAGYRGASINTDTRTTNSGGPNGYHPQAGTGSGWLNVNGNTPSGSAAVSSRWDHVVTTWSTGNPLRTYENGSLLTADTNAPSVSINWGSTYWSLGRQLANSGYPRAYSGYIAIARIYNTALSASDVLYNFNGQRGRFGV